MEYRDGMFQKILAPYALFEIQSAFLKFIGEKPDLPTPSEIKHIIEDDRKYRLMKKPDLETLRRYRDKGIKLSSEQLEFVESHDAR